MSHQNTDRDGFPEKWEVDEAYREALRYGENPHQDAAVYVDESVSEANVVHADQLNEGAKGLSYVNYLDAQGALETVVEFDDPAAVVVKHTNPAGCAVASTLEDAYERAHATDPMSAYGGIVALNRECGVETAERILDGPFKAIVVAPAYSERALELLREEANLRILDVGELRTDVERLTEKQLVGGRVVQERDRGRLTADDLECVTNRAPTDDQRESLLFAWRVVKHVFSNATVFASGTETVGIGAGQPSRVDSVLVAKRKAADHAEGKDAAGAVLATDGFAFPDTVEVAAEAGIEAIVQPGGSIRDEEVIAAANEHDIAMVFTGQRCFRHG